MWSQSKEFAGEIITRGIIGLLVGPPGPYQNYSPMEAVGGFRGNYVILVTIMTVRGVTTKAYS